MIDNEEILPINSGIYYDTSNSTTGYTNVYYPTITTSGTSTVGVMPTYINPYNTGNLPYPQQPLITPATNPYYYGPTMNINNGTGYKVMTLPVKSMPKMVYLSGRLLTFGVLGSEAECAYVGGSKLVFREQIMNSTITYGYNAKPTIILQYKKKIYHYVINSREKTTLDVSLLSEVIL